MTSPLIGQNLVGGLLLRYRNVYYQFQVKAVGGLEDHDEYPIITKSEFFTYMSPSSTPTSPHNSSPLQYVSGVL